MSLITAAANQSKQHNSQVAFEIFGEKRREKQFPGKNHSKSSQSWDKMNKERFSSKSRVGTINDKERYKKSLTSSPLYRSTLDSLVDEDNVVRVTEDLKVFYFSFEKIFVKIFSRLHKHLIKYQYLRR